MNIFILFFCLLESHASQSAASVRSGISMKSRIAEQKKREARKKAEWDQSTTVSKQDQPDDYVLSTNEYHSVREFVEKTFALKGFDIKWKGEGVNEIGYDAKTGRELIMVSEKYFRPAEVEELLGDSTKARTELGWKPSYSFDELVKEMVESDCK